MKKNEQSLIMKIRKIKNRDISQYFVLICLLFGLTIFTAVGILYKLEINDYMDRIKLEEQVSLKLQDHQIKVNFESIISDLFFLSRQNELLNLINNDEATSKSFISRSLISREYLEFIQKKQVYDQIRYLDETGMEIVRVNYNFGNPTIVSAKNLQNKGNRYYFTDTFACESGELFISPLDLNMEKGKIEIPFKPMIRFGTPVLDNENKKQGIILFNYLGEKLLNGIRETAKSSPGGIMLVNSDGYWLLNPTKEDEWGFMLPQRSHQKFSLKYPDVWEKINSEQLFQVENESGLFTSTTIYPVTNNIQSGIGTSSGIGKKQAGSKEYYWKIISYIPVQDLRAATRGLFNKLFTVAMVLFLLTIFPSWVIARAIVRRKLHQIEIKQYWVQLEALVNQRTKELTHTNKELVKFSRAVEQSSVTVVILDLEGNIEYVNSKFCEVTGYRVEEVIGQNRDILKPGNNNHDVYSKIWEAITSGNEWRGELLTKKKNNDLFWESSSISPIISDDKTISHYLMVNEDITERKKIENELQESEEHVNIILDSINIGVILIDPEIRTIIDINPMGAKLIGLQKENIIGKKCHKFICPREYNNCPIIDHGKTIDNAERVLLTAQGNQIPVLKTVVPIMLSGKKFLLESFVDITQSKEDEAELKKNIEDLERFSQLTIHREEKMIQLKQEINDLLKNAGEKPKYKIV